MRTRSYSKNQDHIVGGENSSYLERRSTRALVSRVSTGKAGPLLPGSPAQASGVVSETICDEDVGRYETRRDGGYGRSCSDVQLRTKRHRQVMREREHVLYRGSENTLLLIYVMRIEAMCIFRLHNYPFDKQKCQLRFNYYDNPEISVLQKGGITIDATRELLEYEIINETMTVGASTHYMSNIQVEIEFQNQYTFYITNVIVPTLLMAIICYLTFFFKLNDFQDRIVISLTSMLVLATLFTQMSQSIPKTAYFKVIDGWFMCLIVIDFLVVVIHTIIENLCGTRASSLNKSVKQSPTQVAWSSHEQNNTKGFIMAQRVNVASQIIFPLLITFMCTIFVIFGYSSLYMTP